MNDLIPTLTFDTAAWPPEERFAAWAAHNRGSSFIKTGEGSFEARAKVWLLDGMIVSEHHVDAFNGSRDRRQAQAAGMDHAMLILPLSGTTRLRSEGLDVLCQPGDVAFVDYGRALSTENSQQHGIAISIRRDLLEERCGPLDLHGRLPPSAETKILAGYLRQLVQHLPATRRGAVMTLTRVLRDLIVLALGEAASVRSSGGRHPELRTRIIRHMASMPPGSVTMASILSGVGTTRSTIYRLFRADGGVLAYDRKRRLGSVHRALCDGDIRSLGELGAAFGFADPAGLARLFRHHYGYSMTDFRRHLTSPSIDRPFAIGVVETYRRAVASLSTA